MTDTMTERAEMLTRANDALQTYAASIGLIYGTEAFYSHLAGGKAPYVLHPRGDINDVDSFDGFDLFFSDEEADLMKAAFDASGEVQIHPGEYTYIMLTSEHLKLLSFAVDLVKPIIDDFTDEIMEAEEAAIAAEEAALAAAEDAATETQH